MIGSSIVYASSTGIRKNDTLITGDLSRFVPHLFPKYT